MRRDYIMELNERIVRFATTARIFALVGNVTKETAEFKNFLIFFKFPRVIKLVPLPRAI